MFFIVNNKRIVFPFINTARSHLFLSFVTWSVTMPVCLSPRVNQLSSFLLLPCSVIVINLIVFKASACPHVVPNISILYQESAISRLQKVSYSVSRLYWTWLCILFLFFLLFTIFSLLFSFLIIRSCYRFNCRRKSFPVPSRELDEQVERE